MSYQNERSFTEEEEEKLQAVFEVESRDLKLVLETITFFLQQVCACVVTS